MAGGKNAGCKPKKEKGMKLKEKMKRFWTMDVHNHEGFTLVELIIVIAILAILAGVAVVGYSAYIEKANQQADQTMIAEIENALMLAGYSDAFDEGEGGYIVLSTNGVVNDIPENSALDLVMDDAFGTNWRTTLKLKFNGWHNNGLFSSLSPFAADAVVNSSYLTGERTDKLLTDVEIMTGMANNLVDALNGGNVSADNKTLSEVFTKADGTCVLDETAAKYGVSKGNYATWEEWAAASDENKTAYSNLLVLAAADESEKYMSSAGTDNEYEMSAASFMIVNFSSYYAFAAQNSEFSPVLDKYMAHLNAVDDNDPNLIPGLARVTDSETGKAWYLSLQNVAGTYGYQEDYYETEQNGKDATAFLAIMAGIGNPSSDQASQVGADLSNPNLFTEGVVNGMYNDFLAGAGAVAGAYDPNNMESSIKNLNLADGNVAIFVVMRDGNLTVVDSIS